MLVDTHAHLTADVFQDDLESVLVRSQEAGVTRIVCIGDRYDSSRQAVAMASAYPSLWATVGVHPHQASEAGDELESTLLALAEEPRVVAIGETGLDYHYDFAPRDVQQDVFRRHIRVAKEVGLPIVVHNRESGDDVLRLLEEEDGTAVGGVLHCFWGTPEEAQRALDMGFYLGVGGSITFKNNDALRELVATLPLERLIVETDAPYLTPVPHRGQRNEPAYTRLSALELATVKGVSFEDVARTTSDNAARLFGLS